MAREERGSVRLAFNSGYFMCGNDVFNLPLPSIEKIIYMALTRYAGSNNRAWPNYETLARDASCSKRRAIDAVNTLCQCKLIAKETRGNRSNIYMVFPPKYYCEQNSKDIEIKQGAQGAPQKNDVASLYQNEGEKSAPLKNGRVHRLHPEGEDPAPTECSSCNLSVQEMHPNINKNSNKNINTEQKNRESENSSKITDQEIETIRKAFKEKNSVVRDVVIKELLKVYPLEDIKAAIKGTDFEEARNPIAVIKWMLREGSYVMPLGMEELKGMPADDEPPLVNDEEVRKMISETKDNLSGKSKAGVY